MKIYIRRPDDERMVVYVDRKEIIAANHDEHGWSGMDAIEQTVRKLGKALGVEVVE